MSYMLQPAALTLICRNWFDSILLGLIKIMMSIIFKVVMCRLFKVGSFDVTINHTLFGSLSFENRLIFKYCASK